MRDLPLFQRVKALQQQLTSAQDGKKQRDQYQYRSHAERIKHPKCGADFVLRHEAEAGKDGKCARQGCCVCDCPALLIVRGELQPKRHHSNMAATPPPLNIPIDASRSSSSGSNAGGSSSNLGGVVAIIPASGAQPAPYKCPTATTPNTSTSAAAANDTNRRPDKPSPAELPTQPAAPADAVAGGTQDSTGALLPPQLQPSAAAAAVAAAAAAAAAAAEGDVTNVWPKQQHLQQQPVRRSPSAPGCLDAASEPSCVWHDCQGAHKPRLSAAAGDAAAAGAEAVIDLDTWACLLKQDADLPASQQHQHHAAPPAEQPKKQQPDEDGGELPDIQLNRTRTGPGAETTDCDLPGRESGTPPQSGVSRVHALWRADEWAGSLVEMMIADRVLPPFKKARSPMQLAWRRVKKAAVAPVRLIRRLFGRQAGTGAVWASEV